MDFPASSNPDRGSEGPSARGAAVPRSASREFVAAIARPQPPNGLVLPPIQNEIFTSQRHEVNPALALNLLQDIQDKVTTWQEQLRQIVQALHALHAQGPMVDGWLESSLETGTLGADSSCSESTPDANPDANILRHGDTETLMQYVEALENGHLENGHVERPEEAATRDTIQNDIQNSFSHHSSQAQYRLCSLDSDGKVRSQPCPAEQMAVVSLAIGRYQKFRQLLNKKQRLEAKLQKTVDELTGVRAVLQALQMEN